MFYTPAHFKCYEEGNALVPFVRPQGHTIPNGSFKHNFGLFTRKFHSACLIYCSHTILE